MKDAVIVFEYSQLDWKSVTRKLRQISLSKSDRAMVLRLIKDHLYGLWANVLIYEGSKAELMLCS